MVLNREDRVSDGLLVFETLCESWLQSECVAVGSYAVQSVDFQVLDLIVLMAVDFDFYLHRGAQSLLKLRQRR